MKAQRKTKYFIVVLLLYGFLPLASRAGDVYRWVDERGKVHYGDSVPDRYKQDAKRMLSEGPEITVPRQRAAEARLARDKNALDALNKAPETKPDAQQSGPASTSPRAAAGANSNDDCQAQLKRFLESQACFGRFTLRGGGVRAEAFKECTEVKEPAGCTQNSVPAPAREYGTAQPR